jgi:precorrin isomerase
VVREKAAVARATVVVLGEAEKEMLTVGGMEAAGWAAVWAAVGLAVGLVVAQEAAVRDVAG